MTTLHPSTRAAIIRRASTTDQDRAERIAAKYSPRLALAISTHVARRTARKTA